MKIEFDPLVATERQVVARLLTILEGAEAAAAPTALIASDAEVTAIRKEKASKARKAVEKSREEAAAVSAPVVVAVDPAAPGAEQTVEVTLPPGYEQTSILDAMAPKAEEPVKRVEIVVVDEIKPDPKPAEPAKVPSIEEARNALVAYATAMAVKADAALDAAAKAQWGKDQARKLLNEVGKAASISAVSEGLRAALIAACKVG